MPTDFQRIPPLSLSRLLSMPHGDYDVLLGVGMDGQPVTHPARVQDGGSPSLLVVGMDGKEIMSMIWVSWFAWYSRVATISPFVDDGLDPNPYHTGLRIEWHDAMLTVTWRQQERLTVRGCRCYCQEHQRGVWWYWRRNQRGVPFYACRESAR